MKLSFSVDDQVLQEATRVASAKGTTIEQLVREFLTEFAANANDEALANEFERLSRESKGDSRGWKFNREEIHDRKL